MKPTYEEYLSAKEVVTAYEQEEKNEEVPRIIGYLTTRIGYNGYITCVEGHPVFELDGMYYIEMDPSENSKMLPTKMKYYKHSLDPYINKI